ncbi:hypothetical protein [Streptomyces sp. NPDC088707]|uniref:hypothetical protein n=1 Tax=Streptomyces sp. NPDC088707 TaxID=3365871 RepID=UPI003810E52F
MTAFQESDRRQEAKPTQVAHTAHDKAGEAAAVLGDKATDVAQTAKEQAAHVVGETQAQAKDLVGEFRAQLQDQAGTQTQRLADNVRKLAGEIHDMSEKGEPDSTAAGLARQMADRGHRVADHLEQRGPDGLVSDLQNFARRRPGVFLAGAALAGFALARAGKGMGAAASNGSDAAGSAGTREEASAPPPAIDSRSPLATPQERIGGEAIADPTDVYGQSQPPHVTHTPSGAPAPPAYPPTSPDSARRYGQGARTEEGI